MRGSHRKEQCPHCQSCNTTQKRTRSLKRTDTLLAHKTAVYLCRNCSRQFKIRYLYEPVGD